MNKMEKGVVLYTRVSTDEQANNTSLGYQKERLYKYAKLMKLTVVSHFEEDHSAKNFNRPEFIKMLELLKKRKNEISRLVFLKWDRFSRDATDSYQMIRIIHNLGIEIDCVEQPLDFAVPENKFLLAFYLTAPEVENDRRASATKSGTRRTKLEGKWMASAPKGYSNVQEDGTNLLNLTQTLNLSKRLFN